MMPTRPIRLLIVDDSALVREILSTGLAKDPGIQVVGTASNPYEARDKIVQLRPDVLTLDVEMPRMDGVEFLRKLMPQFPIPVVMVSSLTESGKKITFDALEAGALDFVSKPRSNVAAGLSSMLMELSTKVKLASTVDVSHWKGKRVERGARGPIQSSALEESTDKVVAIGASTGGTEAIKEVITRFPVTMPGVIIVQHMPAGFTKMFADRLNSLSPMMVKEAENGDRIMAGRVLVAPGGKQMRVVRRGGIYQVEVKPGEPVMGHCPSVEVMMQSVAKEVGKNAVGVMLTGMGSDGCTGMKAMADAGALCVAQDEATSVVFGMPKEAYARGGAKKLVPLGDMAQTVINMVNRLAA
ncbi:two-component system, chemotaxis family, response regulator CheB [Desulfatibacillum alkenivorans DSM 16219]|uniref:Protein-glutamate methylesterase/protein-glutamine glutaminase n=1 Tax=Desulfatibacillum alkenivorans DSM 16219 TaxID=1121393 RepID=A0A1M6F486_9BACT|nr:chemotaxis response regulator protein-glutamate methylesterase [Desulfatibacillum alkenivorans]SHI92527.1 two-component system, chemotaxis family, response regulator CheB [Desulfatibacillum alkenivorans DSM 16219]